MRPIQFSTLKALNSLDEEPQRAENHDGQADIGKVEHGTAPSKVQTGSLRPANAIKAPMGVPVPAPCATHAPGTGFLTKAMRFVGFCGVWPVRPG